MWTLSTVISPAQELRGLGREDGTNARFVSTAPDSSAGTSRRKVWIVVSSPETARSFLSDHLIALRDRYEVTLVANTTDKYVHLRSGMPFEVRGIRIERRIALLSDLAALWTLCKELRSARADMVHSITPKAGLLAMMAGWLSGVPVRLHTYTGQVWATQTGTGRWILKTCDRLIAWCATDLTADSPSQREFLVREGVLRRGEATVFADGSLGGVDTERFHPDSENRLKVRSDLGVSDQLVFLFVGRLKRDKGILDLVDAFAGLRAEGANVVLWVAGLDEEGIVARLSTRDLTGIRFFGHTESPELYMQAADVLCLPSYREGIGTVTLEAAACEVPVIASRIYGITDAVEENVTGLLHPPGDVASLRDCMKNLYENPERRQMLAANAARRAVSRFSMKRLTEAVVSLYDALLG